VNKRAVLVRDRETDRRVARTQRALIQALVDLALKRRYERITIQQILDRADVGRSTFYTHFRSKDDLLLRSFQGMLGQFDHALDAEEGSSGRVAPVRELFAHIGSFRAFHQAMVRARMIDRVHQAGADLLARTIERRLQARPGKVPAAVAAPALAGALFALLRWWLETDTRYTPEDMDAMFHALLG